MKNPIETSIKKEALNLNIEKVMVALSGGADSVATSFALKQTGIYVMALHCNFHLRAEESDRDTQFVEYFCKEHSIPLKIIHFNIPEYLEEHKGESVEMACRNLRHEWFRNQLSESGFDRIATGHNADDNIETFFLNVFRGSGSRGLKAMLPDNGIIWRPVLSFHRREILDYLKQNNLSYIVDSTNLLSDYRRNYLRNEIIPLLKSQWKGFDSALKRTIENLQSENLIVEHSLEEILSINSDRISVETILNFPAPLLLIKRFIQILDPFVTTPDEVLSAIYANKPHIRKWRLRKGDLILRNRILFIKMGHGERST